MQTRFASLDRAQRTRERAAQPLAEAERLRREMEEMQAKYEAALESARTTARAEIEQMRREAEADEARVLASARAEAAEILDDVRTTLAQEIEAAHSSMARHAAELSVAAAEKVLGRSIQ